MFKTTLWHLSGDKTIDARKEAGKVVRMEMMVAWARIAPVEVSAVDRGRIYLKNRFNRI